MILVKGQSLTIPVAVKVVVPFVYKESVYYICKADNSYTDTVWIVNSDGTPIDITPELLDKASKVLQ